MSDRTIVITGGSAGIGAALAERLTARGDRVAIVARREEALRQVAERCAGRAHPIVADVTARGAVQNVVREAITRLGHVDVWVNNAGAGSPVSCLAAHRRRRRRHDARQREVCIVRDAGDPAALHRAGDRQIINVSSMLGRVPMATFRSAYNGAKHFLNAITANLREELREQHPGITVSLVSPGVVATEFGVNAALRRPGLARAADVAAGGGGGRGDRARDRHACVGRVHATRNAADGAGLLRADGRIRRKARDGRR